MEYEFKKKIESKTEFFKMGNYDWSDPLAHHRHEQMMEMLEEERGFDLPEDDGVDGWGIPDPNGRERGDPCRGLREVLSEKFVRIG